MGLFRNSKKMKARKQKRQEDLERLLEQGGPDLDVTTLKYMIEFELSDLIWEHHETSGFGMSTVMILTQLAFVILNCILLILNIHLGLTVTFVTTAILFLVIMNNYLHTKSWKNARNRAETINKMVEMLVVNSKLECLRELDEKYGIKVKEDE